MLILTTRVGRREVDDDSLRDVADLAGHAVDGTLVTSNWSTGFLTVNHDIAPERAFGRLRADRQIPALTVARGELVAYGWLSTPDSSRPHHLPRKASGRFWIHDCGTAPNWRGRGLYKQTLQELCRLAWEANGCAPTFVYVDVSPDNEAAVAAITSLRFIPAGVARAIHVPRVGFTARTWLERPR